MDRIYYFYRMARFLLKYFWKFQFSKNFQDFKIFEDFEIFEFPAGSNEDIEETM